MILTTQSMGQSYEKAIGARLGYPGMALTYKHGIQDAFLEFIVGARYEGGVNIEAIYELQWKLDQKLFPTDELHWYLGAGGSIWTGDGDAAVGIGGIIGLEYVFTKAPIALTIDYKPVMYLNNGANFAGDHSALSVRYTF